MDYEAGYSGGTVLHLIMHTKYKNVNALKNALPLLQNQAGALSYEHYEESQKDK